MLGGNTYSRHMFYTHLKSLLSFSNSSLHLHIIADSENIEDVSTLLNSWKIPRCSHTFYNEHNYTDQISWVPGEHYSRQFGYLKLLVPYILSTTDKVIILDVDLIFQVDVKQLWDMFHAFNSSQFLRLAPETSGWYRSGHQKAWPAIENGFNTGLELLDLRKMREIGWDWQWRNLTERHYARIKGNPIADQDIMNTWILENPSTFYRIPCYYNYELGDASRPELCPFLPLLIHFNTKTKDVRVGFEKFVQIRKSFMNKDGEDVVRWRDSLRIAGSERILPNAYGRRNQSELCWGTYANVSGVDNFLEASGFWSLPISIVLYGTDSDVTHLSEKLMALNRQDITIHNVYSTSQTHPLFLKNLLISHSNCDQLLISDTNSSAVRYLGEEVVVLEE